ncbi:MAG TPA: carbohydrate porin [Synechococcales cyanobacterium M55_K2018_004]|nr:carbohydrate porin [Synechococcales cyanobacterium M55_K2018_004]
MFAKVLLNSLLVTPALLGAALVATSSAFAANATDDAKSLRPEASAVVDPSASVDAIAEAAAPASTAVPIQLAQVPAPATATPSVASLEQVAEYGSQSGNAMSQVTSVNQLSDVRPTDWAYEALSRLIQNYGCIAGYPDGTFRGNRAMTRYEFAAGLNACLDALAERVGAGGGVSQEDLDALRRLVDEFRSELATLRGRVDNLEARVTELEQNQFSTTTVLRGRTIFSFADAFGDDVDDNNNFVFQSRVRLNFDTSFYGTDRLRARLQAGNFERFTVPSRTLSDIPAGDVFAGQLDLSYGTNTRNDFRLSRLEYYFPVGPATIYLGAVGQGISDIVTSVSPLDDPEQGSLSYFGYNPIYDVGAQGIGVGATFDFTDDIQLGLGYLSDEGNKPGVGAGLFNGNNTFFGQLTISPGPLTLALTYVNSYVSFDNPAPLGDSPSVFNAYGASVNFALTESLQLGGWISYITSRTFAGPTGFLGDGRHWTYAGYLALGDVGTPGSLLGLIVGVPPRTAIFRFAGTGTAYGQDAALHIEAFYRFALTDNISITPGIIWVSDPGNDNSNDSVFIGAVRTSFSF